MDEETLRSNLGTILETALAYMVSALELLDHARALADIGAHLDLALCRLQTVIDAAADQRAPITHPAARTRDIVDRTLQRRHDC